MPFTLTQDSTPARPAHRSLPFSGVVCFLAVLILSGVYAGSAEAVINFTFTAEKTIKVGPTGLDYVKVDCILENTGDESDSYDILRPLQELPGGSWATSICTGGDDGFLTNGMAGGCQAPFVDSLYAGVPPCGFPSCAGPSNLTLTPGQVDTVSGYFTPDGPEAAAYMMMDVQSVGDPSLRKRITLGCITDGVDVLLVKDTTDETIAPFYQAAVPVVLEQATWRRQVGVASAAQLSSFDTVIWFTGTETSTLDADDRAALEGYLNGGGHLVLSGQDIAYDLNDPGSPNQSAATVAWFEDNLRSRYVDDNSLSLFLFGIGSDPVSNGLDLLIQGGDGANNQTDPDRIDPLTGGGGMWSYEDDGAKQAGVRWLDGNSPRGVNLPFGFEAISSAADRSEVMTRILQWFMVSPIAVSDAGVGAVPGAFELEEPRPNPFNPSTQIAFTLNESGAVRLRILDASGRQVRVLADGAVSAGRQQFSWDGRDDVGRGVASGVYMAELSVDGHGSDRVKLSLIR